MRSRVFVILSWVNGYSKANKPSKAEAQEDWM